MTDRTDSEAEAIGPALKEVLRPLVKLLIARGVTAPGLYAVLKELYVEVAIQAFQLDGKPPTDSRVNMLTGVHRKNVREIRQSGEASDRPLERRVSVMTTVVGRWLADPATTDEAGAPRPLPRQSSDGPSFDALVEAVNTDIRPRTILDELINRGVVDLDEAADEVRLHAEALLPRESEIERYHFFGRNLGDHMAAAIENVLTEKGPAPFLERAVFYNNLRAASVDEIEARARALAADSLAELNRMGYARQNEDAESGNGEDKPGERFRYGVYFYREDEAARDEGRERTEEE